MKGLALTPCPLSGGRIQKWGNLYQLSQLLCGARGRSSLGRPHHSTPDEQQDINVVSVLPETPSLHFVQKHTCQQAPIVENERARGSKAKTGSVFYLFTFF